MKKKIAVIIIVVILIAGLGFILIQHFMDGSGGPNDIKNPPVNPAVNITFIDTDPDVLEIGGTINITRAINESDITHYVLYWGSGPSTKSGPAIAELNKTGANLNYSISQNRSISVSRTHFLVFSKNEVGEMATGVNVSISDYTLPTERLQNGGFESGYGVGWNQTEGSYDIIAHSSEGGQIRTGSWSAWHGGDTSYTDTQYQQVTISPNATVVTFRYYYYIYTQESSGIAYDLLYVRISGNLLATYSNLDDTASSWVLVNFDLSSYIGQTITISFSSSNDISDVTNFFIDDVSLLVND
jgi:hypothetical protein